MDTLAGRLARAVRAAGVPIDDVSIVDVNTRASWKVNPASLQAAAQSTIDAFNQNDPALLDADLDAEVKQAIDNERLISAVVWTILDTYAEFKPATIPKYNAARTKVIAVYKSRPWLP